jgi:hypothetical protein
VELTEKRWDHIVAGHPELARFRAEVIQAVQAPSHHIPGRRSAEEWYYLEGVGPSRYLKVVVSYESGTGRVVTAFARRSKP